MTENMTFKNRNKEDISIGLLKDNKGTPPFDLFYFMSVKTWTVQCNYPRAKIPDKYDQPRNSSNPLNPLSTSQTRFQTATPIAIPQTKKEATQAKAPSSRPHPQSQHIKANEGYLCQRFMLISLLRMEQLSHHGLTGKNQAKRRDSCTKRTLENPIPSLSVTVLYSPTLHRKTIGRGTAHIIWHCRGRVQPCGKSYWPPPVLPSEVNLITKKSNTFLLEFTSTNCAKLLVSISLLCWAAQ